MKSDRIIRLCFFGILITVCMIKHTSCNTLDSMEEILQFWRQQDEAFRLGTQKDVVLILGNTGSGKSTVTSFITSNDLESYETSSGSGTFLIVDKMNDRIGESSTIISKTLIPELVIEPVSQIAFYDCPGFSDTRSAAHDITTSYFIHKLLEFSRSVKLVFTISYSSIVVNGDRRDFTDLTRHATSLIKNIDRYSNGIALVVTKVDNVLIKKNGEFVLVSDAKVMEGISNFLDRAKLDLKSLNNRTSTSQKDRKINEGAIKFIDIVSNTTHKRIGIFRKPNERGKLKDMALLQSEKNTIVDIINHNIQYIEKGNVDDFSYTLSDKWENRVVGLINKIQSHTIACISKTGDHIEDFFVQQEKQGMELIALYEKIFSFRQNLLKIVADEPPQIFLKQFVNAVTALEINHTIDDVTSLSRNIGYTAFLTKLSGTSLSDSDQFVNELNKLQQRLGDRLGQLFDKVENNLISYVASISNETEQFILTEEIQNSDLILLHNKMLSAHQNLSETYTNDALLFMEQFINTASVNSYGISIENLRASSNIIRFMKANHHRPLSISHELSNGIHQIITRFGNAGKWQGFLIDLYVQITTNVPYETFKMEAKQFMQNLMIGETEKLNVKDIGLKEFLDRVGISILRDVETLQVNSFEVNALKTVLNTIKNDVLNDNGNATCSSTKLTVSQKTIRMSEIIKMKCWEAATVIEIFALDRILFDADIDKFGKGVQLSIIAPTWIISGPKQINLNGKNGEAFSITKARDGNKTYRDGVKGQPGLPGYPGGSFIGIGSTFRHDTFLSINSEGGNGAAGQDGGRGSDATAGEDPPVDRNENPEPRWKALDFEFTKSEDHDSFSSSRFGTTFQYYNYEVFGKDATPGNGGFGGAAGLAASSGQVSIFGLRDTPNIAISKYNGKDGSPGKGGIGGAAAPNGKTAKLKYSERNGSAGYAYRLINENYESAGMSPRGRDGTEGANRVDRKDPTPSLSISNPSHIINSYKNYARRNLANNIRESKLRNFINELENNKRIQELYDVSGLLNEFQGLEDQYFKLKNEIAFNPFIESLLRRIKEYAKTNANITMEDKKVLSFLYTAALSKMFSVNNISKGKTVVDFLEYLNLMKDNIQELKISTTQKIFNDHRNKYNETLNSKIKSITTFIDTQITPEIDNILKQTDDKIRDLIDENAEKQKQKEKEIKTHLERQEQLKNALILRQMLFPMKFMSSLLSVFGPFGATAGLAIGGTAMITDALLLDDTSGQGNDRINPLNPALKASVNKVTEQLNAQNQLLKYQVEDIDRYLNENSINDLDEAADLTNIRKKVRETKAEMRELYERDSYDPAVFDRVRQLRVNLAEVTDNQKKILEQQKAAAKVNEFKKKEIIDKKLKIVGHVQTVVGIAELSIDHYNRIRNDEAKLEKTTQAIDALRDDLTTIEQHQQNIYKVMVPQLEEIQKTIIEAEKLKDKSHAELDIRKWNIQSVLRDVKIFFRKMTIDFAVQDDLLRCIEKLDEAIAVLIDVFDRIDSYADNAKLAAYISDIESSKSQALRVTDYRLADAITNLKRMIQSNLILEQYEVAMNAFQQHQFPFAHQYLGKFVLPKNLQLNDTESLVDTAVVQITSLMNDIKKAQNSLGHYDQYRHSDVQYNSKMKHSTPFFVLKNHVFAKEVAKLLEGREISILADITKGVNENAVKFNEIGINFLIANESRQNELNIELENFQLTMTMVGNGYYRCGERVFYMPVDNNIVINYRMIKDRNGEPTYPNDVYRKIKENDYFLSPYAMWTIMLENITVGAFAGLERFKEDVIDLELVGRGQYLESKGSAVCNDQLNKYYRLSNV